MPWPSKARRTSIPEQAIAVLQAGKHLYLAKPMAVDVAGCLAIERAVKAAGPSRHVLVDFQTRRDPLFRRRPRACTAETSVPPCSATSTTTPGA